METVKLDADPETFGKIKIDNTGRRMKLYIKLNQGETAAWEQIKMAFTGGEVPDDQLARIFLFRGIQAIQEELNARIEAMSDEEREAILAEMSADTSDSPAPVDTSGVSGVPPVSG